VCDHLGRHALNMANAPGFLMPYHPATPVTSSTTSQERSRRVSSEDLSAHSQWEGTDKEIPVESSARKTRLRSKTQSRQKLVFSDPVAFRYLEEDPATVVLDRRRRLEGYEMYIVEQWACSRVHPTFIICTYTGDATHSILVNVLGVPKDESTWSSRLKVYFQAVSRFHARKKDTPLGTLMVTHLSSFPSAFTVIAVPDGDVKKHREDFIVNENLKRMGCSGRAAINLQYPQASTVAKFHHLYRTSEAVPLYQSVMELVRICQTVLVMYGKLDPTYADGLLCDITEKAITNWWTDIGIYFYNVEPSDGIFGPTTVAALLGLAIGAYNRLKAFGAPVGKDVLDTVSMRRAVGHFQKAQKMDKSRCLNRETLDRLHRATAKTASGEGWTVPKAVKSTVAELSGKGGEMVMGIVGAREKAGISDAETLDIDRFAELVTGARMKWLWHGKPMKSGDVLGAPSDELNGRIFSTDDQGNYLWTSSTPDSARDRDLERTETMYSHHTGEGRSGFGRIRDAVGGLKTHTQRSHKDGEDHPESMEQITTSGSRLSLREPSVYRDHASSRPRTPSQAGQSAKLPLELALADAQPASSQDSRSASQLGIGSTDAQRFAHRQQLLPVPAEESPRRRKIEAEMADLRDEIKADLYRTFSAGYQYQAPRGRALRRSQSAIQIVDRGKDSPRQNKLNRQLSFSVVENTVLNFGDPVFDQGFHDGRDNVSVASAMAYRDALIASAWRKSRRILQIQRFFVPYVESRVAHVESVDRQAQQDLEALNEMYYGRLDNYQTLRATSSDLVSHERTALRESLRRLEMLGAKLDYELNTLHSRMQEVEDSVGEFERSILAIEARVRGLIGAEGHNSIPWFQRLLNNLRP